MENDFKVGDVVILKSGGPRMTIEGIDKYGLSTVKKALCTWFDGNKKVSEIFTMEAIELYDED